jgi:hypothetical protein
MGGFIVYHPLYTTENEGKSQEGELKSRMDRQLGSSLGAVSWRRASQLGI